MIHCFECGADLADNLTYCLHCGAKLETVSEPTLELPPRVDSAAPTERIEPQTAFEKRLEEAQRLSEERAFNRQKRQLLDSAEGIAAIEAEFANLTEVAQSKLAQLKEKDFESQQEKAPNGRAFVIRADRFSVSFAIDVHPSSRVTEFHLFVRYWKGRKTLNPNANYVFPEDEAKNVWKLECVPDMDTSKRICWITPKKTQYYSEALVDLSLVWLVDEVAEAQRKRG